MVERRTMRILMYRRGQYDYSCILYRHIVCTMFTRGRRLQGCTFLVLFTQSNLVGLVSWRDTVKRDLATAWVMTDWAGGRGQAKGARGAYRS